MPLIYVQRYGQPIVIGGTQYIAAGGTLEFTGPTEIELDPSVFTEAGTYVLFDYAGASFPGGQAALNANVVINDADLVGLTVQNAGKIPLNDPTNFRITVTLG